jgi:HEPN superfamily protein
MMISVTPEKVRQKIAAVCALSQFNEHIRAHVIDEADLSAAAVTAGAMNYIEARRYIAESVQWRVFSHCASVTRLYALYEGFVYELVSAWLEVIPSLYPSYARLPEAIINQHRVGVGVLLQKFGGGFRNEELTELRIVQPLYSGLSGQQEFSLISEAFFTDLRNLRHEELCALFRRVSLDNLGGWLGSHADLRAMCDAAGTTVIGRLKELIEFRNEASHARQEIDETLGASALEEFAEFIQVLCGALHEFVMARYLDVLQESGRLELLGRITEYLPRPDAAILTTTGDVEVSVGDAVIARGPRTNIATTIVSLQDHDEPVQALMAVAGYELGVKFDPTVVRTGAYIYRVKPAPAVDDAGIEASRGPDATYDQPVASNTEESAAIAHPEPAAVDPGIVTSTIADGASKWDEIFRRLRRWFRR